MSHYKIQQTLDLAPQMSSNSITSLLLKQDPPEISKSKVAIEDEGAQEPAQDSSLEIIDDGETIPYNYIRECKQLLSDLEPHCHVSTTEI